MQVRFSGFGVEVALRQNTGNYVIRGIGLQDYDEFQVKVFQDWGCTEFGLEVLEYLITDCILLERRPPQVILMLF